MDIHVHCSKTIPRIAQRKQTSLEAAEASALVRSIYDAGSPVHSKEAMREVVQMLKNENTEIRVRAIDGQYMHFERETGQIFDDDDDDAEVEWVIGDPFIKFLSVQRVFENTQYYAPPLSLCSMWIYDYLIKRSKVTGAFLRPTPSQSNEEVTQFFEMHRTAWEATDHCGWIRAMLSDTVKSRVTKIIAFACGGMAYNDKEPWAVRSAYQHALLLTIKDVVNKAREGQVSKVECYVQDPAYCDCDREVLALYDIKTLESPEGFLEVDDSTIVLSFGPDVAVRQIIADIACPVMMIWDRVHLDRFVCDVNEDIRRTDPDSPRLNRMLKNLYKESVFPGNLDAFKRMAVFIRKNDCPPAPTPLA